MVSKRLRYQTISFIKLPKSNQHKLGICVLQMRNFVKYAWLILMPVIMYRYTLHMTKDTTMRIVYLFYWMCILYPESHPWFSLFLLFSIRSSIRYFTLPSNTIYLCWVSIWFLWAKGVSFPSLIFNHYIPPVNIPRNTFHLWPRFVKNILICKELCRAKSTMIHHFLVKTCCLVGLPMNPN